jgi:hypothetical protein
MGILEEMEREGGFRKLGDIGRTIWSGAGGRMKRSEGGGFLVLGSSFFVLRFPWRTRNLNAESTSGLAV